MSKDDHESEQAKKRTILLIEDEEDIRFILKSRINKLGFQVLEAGNINDAYKQLGNLDPGEIILLDLTLPDGDGGDFLTDLRERNLNVRVFVCSAYSDRREETLALGADDFFSKPDEYSRLFNILSSTK